MQIRVLGVRSGVQADPVDVRKQDRNLNRQLQTMKGDVRVGLMKGKVGTRGDSQRGSEASVTHDCYNRQYQLLHSSSVEAKKCPFGYPFPKEVGAHDIRESYLGKGSLCSNCFPPKTTFHLGVLSMT